MTNFKIKTVGKMLNICECKIEAEMNEARDARTVDSDSGDLGQQILGQADIQRREEN